MSEEKIPKDVWRAMLMDQENSEWLNKALSLIHPPLKLVQCFSEPFKQHDPIFLTLTGKRSNRLRAEDIIGNLERIREQDKDTLERLVDLWLQDVECMYNEHDSESAFEATPPFFEVLAWLWINTPEARDVSWSLVQLLASQHVEVQASAQRQEAVQEGKGRETSSLKRKIERQSDQLRKVEEASQKLKEQLARERQAKARLQNALKKRTMETATLDSQIRELEKEREALKKTLCSTREEHQIHEYQASERTRQLQMDLDKLHQDYDGACRHSHTLAEKLQQEEAKSAELSDKLEAYQHEIQLVPVDPCGLQEALVIDYEALSEDPTARFVALVDLYSAFLNRQPTPLLEKYTNWTTLDNGVAEGILLLGLERLLCDAVELPIRRFLQTKGFKREALLRALVMKVESPRLERGSDRANG